MSPLSSFASFMCGWLRPMNGATPSRWRGSAGACLPSSPRFRRLSARRPPDDITIHLDAGYDSQKDTAAPRDDHDRLPIRATSLEHPLLSLRILLAEDVAMVRGALVALIQMERDLTVVADVERGDEIDRKSTRLNSSHLGI